MVLGIETFFSPVGQGIQAKSSYSLIPTFPIRDTESDCRYQTSYRHTRDNSYISVPEIFLVDWYNFLNQRIGAVFTFLKLECGLLTSKNILNNQWNFQSQKHLLTLTKRLA